MHATIQPNHTTTIKKHNMNMYVLSRIDENKDKKKVAVIKELKLIAPLLNDIELLLLYTKSISILYHNESYSNLLILITTIFQDVFYVIHVLHLHLYVSSRFTCREYTSSSVNAIKITAENTIIAATTIQTIIMQ